MIHVNFYPADYLRGVRGLTPEEAGIYMALIALMYQEGGAIPDDARWICGAARCSTRAWRRVKDKLCRLGKIIADTDGQLSNRRVLEEIEKAELTAETLRDRARKGGIKSGKSRAISRKNNELDELALQHKFNPSSTAASLKEAPLSPLPSSSPTPPLITIPPIPPENPDLETRVRAAKLAPSWKPDSGLQDYGQKLGFSGAEVEAAASDFVAYWIERTDKDARKTGGGWAQTFRTRLRNIATSSRMRAELRLVNPSSQPLFDGVSNERGYQTSARSAQQSRPPSQAEVAMRLAASARDRESGGRE